MANEIEWRDILQTANAKSCPKCQAEAFVTSAEHESHPPQIQSAVPHTAGGFCFECGYREP